MDFSEELQKIILDKLRKTIKPDNAKSNLSSFIDDSTKSLGFSKISKKGYTP